MSPSRRSFLWTMGAAATAYGIQDTTRVLWSPEPSSQAGWTPGIEKHLTSTCLVCPGRCGIRGRVVDGRLIRLSGNPLHPMNRGGICPRGVAGVQMLYHPDRIVAPLVRVGPRGGGKWRAISREAALTLLVERLRELRAAGRPESLALMAGFCPGTMEDLWRQFLTAFGSPNYVADDYEDGTESVMRLMHGIDRRPGYDMERAAFVLSFGAPLFESWWSPLQAFVAYAGPDERNGQRPRFVQVDTRFSQTAAHVQEWVGIRPDTHGVLALGIAYVLIRDQLYDARFVSQHVSGFEDSVDAAGRLREGYRSMVMRGFRTEEVAATTGVPVERITSLARALAENQPAIAVCGMDVTHAQRGLMAGMAVHSLNVLMGSVNRPGGVLFGQDPPVAPLAAPVMDDTATMGLARGPAGGAGPVLGAHGGASRFAEAVVDGDAAVDTLLLYYSNPFASSIHPQTWHAALARIPFIASFSPFLDETTSQADLVLPDLLPYERWQDAPPPASYPYPVWGLAHPLVKPGTSGLHSGDAVLALARQLGGSVAKSLPYGTFETLLKERARGLFATRRGMLLGNDFERRHQRQMEERGWWLPEHTEFEPFWDDLVRRGGWTDPFFDHTDPGKLAQTASGRVELLPDALAREAVAAGLGPTSYLDLYPAESAPPANFPLRLMPYRLSTLASGTLALERWMSEVPSLFPRVHWNPWVEVHPETARSLGFDDGDFVWIVSSRARMRAQLKTFPGTAPENVCVPYGLRHPDGALANPLQLLEGGGDVLSGLPSWSSTFVRLERA